MFANNCNEFSHTFIAIWVSLLNYSMFIFLHKYLLSPTGKTGGDLWFALRVSVCQSVRHTFLLHIFHETWNMYRWQYREYARRFISFLRQEFWLLWKQQQKNTKNGGVSTVGDIIAWQSLVFMIIFVSYRKLFVYLQSLGRICPAAFQKVLIYARYLKHNYYSFEILLSMFVLCKLWCSIMKPRGN